MPSTTVIIADDHEPMRTLVRSSLELAGLRVLAVAGTGREAVRLAIEHEPDLCLLDVEMPDGDGVQAARVITTRLPATRCVMLSARTDDEHLLAALRAGAVGYLSKSMDLDRLPAAVLGALRGEAAVPRVLVSRVIEELRALDPLPEDGHRVVDVTDDEWRVLQDLRAGGGARRSRWFARQ